MDIDDFNAELLIEGQQEPQAQDLQDLGERE